MRTADLTLELLRQGQPATLRVQGRSMWPTLTAGDLITVEAKENYYLGDVVAFDSGRDSLIVHRLVEVDQDRYRTRGDYLINCDEWMGKSQICGCVVGVQRQWISRLTRTFFGATWIRLGIRQWRVWRAKRD